MTLGQNSVMLPFWGKECWGAKNAKIVPFEPIDRKSWVVQRIQKINILGQLGEKIWEVFLTLKKFCSFPIFPPNWARKLKFGMYIYIVGALNEPSRLFGSTSPSHSLKNVIFWLAFLIFFIFWICSTRNSPLNWARKLKFNMYF